MECHQEINYEGNWFIVAVDIAIFIIIVAVTGGCVCGGDWALFTGDIFRRVVWIIQVQVSA